MLPRWSLLTAVAAALSPCGAALAHGAPASQPLSLSSLQHYPLLIAVGTLALLQSIFIIELLRQRRRRVALLAKLEESEGRYRALIESCPAGIVAYRDERILFANPAAARLYGAENSASYVGTHLSEMVDPRDYPAVLAKMQRILATRQPSPPTIVRLARRDGTTIPVESMGIPVVLDGRATVVAVLRDVTNRLEAERAMREAAKMEGIARLAGGVAHDFNNLLTAILTYASLAGDRAESDEQREFLAAIRGAADRAARLTRQLLTFARKEVVEPTEVDVGRVVENLRELLRSLLCEDIRLTIDIPRDVWRIRIDQNQFEQALMNLATNARDALRGAGDVCISARNRTIVEADPRSGAGPGEYVEVRFSDTGTGIDPAVQHHLFEPFFTTKPVGKGTGLGLATVLGVVKQHGGFIALESQLGHGTEIRILWPRTDGLTDEVQNESSMAGERA